MDQTPYYYICDHALAPNDILSGEFIVDSRGRFHLNVAAAETCAIVTTLGDVCKVGNRFKTNLMRIDRYIDSLDMVSVYKSILYTDDYSVPLMLMRDQSNEFCIEAINHNCKNIAHIKFPTEEHAMLAARSGCKVIDIPSSYQTPEVWLQIVNNDGMELQKIITYDQEILLDAVSNNGMALQFITESTAQEQDLAIESNGLALQFVLEQTLALQMNAVIRDGLALQYVVRPTPEVCMAAIFQDGMALQFIHSQTVEMCEIALGRNGMALQFVHAQTKDLCTIALLNCPHALQFVKFDDKDLNSIAVHQDGMTLQYVRNQMTLVIIAVTQNGMALQFVHQRRSSVCLAAVLNCGMALQFVPNRVLKLTQIQNHAICRDGNAIQFIPYPTEQQKIRAVLQNHESYKFIPKEDFLDAIVTCAIKNKTTTHFTD